MAPHIFSAARTKLNDSKAADMFGEAMQKAEQSQAKQLESDGGSLDPETLQKRVVDAQVLNSFSATHPSHVSLLINP